MQEGQSFYLFECNTKDVDRKFVTFVYGDYIKQLGNLDYTMIFQVRSVMPHEWNKDIYKDLRQKLLPYEVAHKMMSTPIYREKHKLSIWENIMITITELNQDYLNS